MAATITISEEAQAFFDRNPDPDLRALVDEASMEYAEFMGGLPLDVDAFQEEDSPHLKVYISVVSPTGKSLRERLVEFGKAWIPRHTREERRKIGFSIHYV